MKSKRLSALLLAVALALSLCSSASAAATATATVPVTLTVQNEYRAVNVTIPASLPVEVLNGTVITANTAKIINNAATGAVQVTAVSVIDGAYKVGNYDDFSGSQIIALKINGCPTVGSGSLAITASAFPVINAGGELALSYYAKVSTDAANVINANAANVIFTVSVL